MISIIIIVIVITVIIDTSTATTTNATTLSSFILSFTLSIFFLKHRLASIYFLNLRFRRSFNTITKTRLFKYIENFTSKNWKFSDRKLWYFFIFLLKK